MIFVLAKYFLGIWENDLAKIYGYIAKFVGMIKKRRGMYHSLL